MPLKNKSEIRRGENNGFQGKTPKREKDILVSIIISENVQTLIRQFMFKRILKCNNESI